MELVSIGHHVCHDAEFRIVRPQGLEYYILLVFHSAACFGAEKLEERKPGSFVLFRPGTPQYFGAVDHSFCHDWVSFRPGKAEQLKLQRDIVLDTVMAFDELPEVSCLIKLIQQEWYSNAPNKEGVMTDCFAALLGVLARAGKGAESHRPYYTAMLSLRAELYSTPNKWRSAGEMAKQLGISTSYFAHLYRAYFSGTPAADAVRSRMEIAAELLSSTPYRIGEIAERLGYVDDTYFMKQFKKEMGMTPSAYRKQNR